MGTKPKSKKPKRKPSAYNKHVGREMRAGRTMKQAAASWDKKRSKPKPKSGGSRKSSSPTRRSNTKMGKRGGFSTQKLFKIVRLAGLLLPAAGVAMGPGTTDNKAAVIGRMYTGYDYKQKKFNWQWLAQGWTGYLAAVGVTYGIPKLAGLIRGL